MGTVLISVLSVALVSALIVFLSGPFGRPKNHIGGIPAKIKSNEELIAKRLESANFTVTDSYELKQCSDDYTALDLPIRICIDSVSGYIAFVNLLDITLLMVDSCKLLSCEIVQGIQKSGGSFAGAAALTYVDSLKLKLEIDDADNPELVIDMFAGFTTTAQSVTYACAMRFAEKAKSVLDSIIAAHAQCV